MANQAAVGWIDAANMNYALSNNSPYKACDIFLAHTRIDVSGRSISSEGPIGYDQSANACIELVAVVLQRRESLQAANERKRRTSCPSHDPTRS